MDYKLREERNFTTKSTKLFYGKVDSTVELAVSFLEREEALDLGESPWPTHEGGQDTHSVDWDRLFPSESQNFQEKGREPSDAPINDPWQIRDGPEDELTVAINEASSSQRHPIVSTSPPHGGWDICAWYQPIHFFGYDCGIFIKEECVFAQAKAILRHVWFKDPLPCNAVPHVYKSLIRASFLAFYLHEHYHHKTESLGFRLHVATLASAYLPYHRAIYRPNLGKDTLLEEALANADSYHRLYQRPYCTWIWKPVLKATRAYLKATFRTDPPGYRKAVRYLSKRNFDDGENLLQGQIRDASLTPKNAEDWDLAPRMTQSIFTIKSNIWTVVPAGACPVVPVAASPKTCSTAAMIKLLNQFGYQTVPGGKGSHIKMKRPDSPMLVVPGNRKDLTPGVIRNILRGLGGYSFSELSQLLSGQLEPIMAD